ncbi:Prefoldin beta-like protein [Gautieria morchelliformis]|nr:Prefoldin beta-like protein [Gautieria morchelliformis]
MATTAAKQKAKAKDTRRLSDQEVQSNYTRLQGDLQALANKIGELESEAEEHELVLTSLKDVLSKDPGRKCFRLIGGVLVERTVKDVVPALQTNRDGIKRVIVNLAEQYKSKEGEFSAFIQEYNIRPSSQN